MRMKLGVNVDHVATLRQARGEQYPSPVTAAVVAQQAGADQITIHLREDRRHIQDADLPAVAQAISIPLNLEMADTDEMIAIALKQRPHTVTLVPERREEVTTEGGLNVSAMHTRLRTTVAQLKNAGIETSAFIDPLESDIALCAKIGFDTVELHTGTFAAKVTQGQDHSQSLKQLAQAANIAAEHNLRVAAGHGLTLESTRLVASIPTIKELNIGHALISDAILCGLEESVRRYLAACSPHTPTN